MKYLDLYTSLVEANALLPRPQEEISDAVSFMRTTLNSEPSNPDEYEARYYKGLSSAIYSLVDAMQDRVAELDKISSHQGRTLGITNASKARVFLLGETSAGKTTFLQRMFGEPCGKTGPTPITAFTVIHKTTERKSYLEVSFRNSFRVGNQEKEDFVRFLKRYQFFDGFEIEGGEFSTQEEFSMEDKDEFINFIYEANRYPFAFDEITWHHKRSNRQIGFLDYADIYDMPGSGGQAEHTANLESALCRYGDRIDIVLYLIKPDQGIPSSYEVLKALRRRFISLPSRPQLYFVYQIRNQSGFSELEANLRKFITKDESTDAIEPFDPVEQEYFLNTHVLDARGDKDDRVRADIALATVLQNFYVAKANEYLDSVFISKVPKVYEVMTAGRPTSRGINSLLDEFLDGWSLRHGEDGKLPSIREMKEDFMYRFGLMEHFDFSRLSDDLRTTLERTHAMILSNLDDLFSYLKMSPKTLDWIMGSIQKSDYVHGNEKFDKTKYEEAFLEQYRQKDNWQRLVYDIQAFHWLRLNYTGDTIKDIYAKVSAEPVKAYLKEYTERLAMIRNRIPLMSPLGRESEA